MARNDRSQNPGNSRRLFGMGRKTVSATRGSHRNLLLTASCLAGFALAAPQQACAQTVVDGTTLDADADSDLGAANVPVVLSNGGTIHGTGTFDSSVRPTTVEDSGGGFNIDSGVTVGWLGNFNGSPDATLAISGAGTLRLDANNNSYFGRFAITDTTVQFAAGNAFGIQNRMSVDGATLRYSGAGGSFRQRTDFTGNGATFEVFDGSATLNHIERLTGTGVLNKTGAGTLQISRVNSRVGDTNVYQGTLALASGDALDDMGRVTLSGGTSLDVMMDETIGSLAGSGFVTLSGGSLTTGGDGTDGTYSGIISGSGGLIKQGGGIFTLTGANTYTGGTTIGGGTLRVSADNNLGDAAGALNFDSGTLNTTASFTTARATNIADGGATFDTDGGTTLTHNGVVSGTPFGSLTKTGTGTLILGGTNTYSGGTVVDAGILQVSANENLGGATGAVTLVSGNGTLQTTASFDTTARELIVDGAGGTIDTVGAANTLGWTGQLSGTGTLTKTGAGTLRLDANNNGFFGAFAINGGALQFANVNALGLTAPIALDSGTIRYTGALAQSSGHATSIAVGGGTFDITDAAGTLNAVGTISGTGALIKTGAGTLQLSGNNTRVGDTLVSQGTLAVSGGNALGDMSRVGVSAPATFNLLSDETIGSLIGSGAVTLTAGTLTTGGDGTSTSFSGIISGSGGLTKVGAGVFVLTGANTYTGTTSVNAGTLRVSSDGNLGAGGPLSFDGGTLETTASFTTSRATALLAGGGTFDVDDGTTLTHNGVISGTGPLTKIDAGTLVLGGVNTFMGDVNLVGGTISVASDANLGNAANILMFNGGTLQTTASFTTARAATLLAGGGTISTDASTTLTYDGVISGAGALTKVGTGTLILGGANTYSGGTTVWAGTLVGTTTSLQGAIMNNAAVVFDQATAGTYAGVMSGTGTLTKTGAGNVTLSGANTYSGGTTVSAGTLTGTTTSLQGMILNNAAVVFDQAADGTYAGVMSGTGSLTKTGAGNVTLSGANTYSGGTTVSAGTLTGTTTSLQGNILNNAAVVFDQATAGTYAGVMSGTGMLTKAGAGNLTLTGANTYSGGTTISGGTLTGTTTSLQGNILNNAALVFDQSTTGTYAGVISGTGTLTKTGSGTLRLDGANTMSGTTFLQAGTLLVQGSLGNSIVNMTGGRLGGNGPLGGLVATGGTVAPGLSIDTLQVNGNVTLGVNSVFEVEADQTGASDRIAATGTATLQGNRVDLLLAPFRYNPGSQWTVLTAGSITGTFGTITDNANLGFLRPVAVYTATTAVIQLQVDQAALSAAAQTPNQKQTAGAAGQLPLTNAILAELVYVPVAQAPAAFDQLSGEIYASTLAGLTEDARFIRETVTDRLAQGQREERWNLWLTGRGDEADLDGDGNADQLERSNRGIFGGVDGSFDGGFRVGAAAGWNSSDLTVSSRGSQVDVSTIHASIYAGWMGEHVAVRAGAAMSWHKIDTSRSVTVDRLTEHVSSNRNGTTRQFFGEIGYGFGGDKFRIEPFIGIAHATVTTDATTETGGSSALASEEGKLNITYGTIGLRASGELSSSETSVRPFASVAVEQAFNDETPSVRNRFVAGGPLFTISGPPLGRTRALVNAGLTIGTGKIRFDVGYTGALLTEATSHGAKATVSIGF